MRAVLLTRFGGPKELRSAEIPEPHTNRDSVLVRVRAAGVNFADLLIRRGDYPQLPELPFVPGSEFAGEVVAVSPGSAVSAGDRVMGLSPGGGAYAELVAADPSFLFPLPDGLSYEKGAGFLMTFLTAHVALHYQLKVATGRSVLVHGAGGGVGTAAVQLARSLGSRVLATAGSEKKLAAAARLGASVVINYETEDFAERVLAETSGAGVDAVVDLVGGAVFEESLRLVRPLGAVAAVGYASGAWGKIDTPLLAGRSVGVHSLHIGRLMRLETTLVGDAVAQLTRLWGDGMIDPVIGSTYSFETAHAAHEALECRAQLGKAVLLPGPGTTA